MPLSNFSQVEAFFMVFLGAVVWSGPQSQYFAPVQYIDPGGHKPCKSASSRTGFVCSRRHESQEFPVAALGRSSDLG
jgi:hypothetical protein